MAGRRGKAGKNAVRLDPSKCGVSEDSGNKNVCCGRVRVAWNDYYSSGAYLDVDTQKCKFEEDSVMYFTDMFGYGGQWTGVGHTALYSSNKAGFRVYVRSAAPRNVGPPQV